MTANVYRMILVSLFFSGVFVSVNAAAQVSGLRVNADDNVIKISASINSEYQFKQVYLCGLDTIGWRVAGETCSWLIENGTLYRYSGRSDEWSWTSQGAAVYTLSDSNLHAEFPVSMVAGFDSYSIVVQGHEGGPALDHERIRVLVQPPTIRLSGLVPLYAAPTGQRNDPLLVISRQAETVIISGNNSGSGGVCAVGSLYPQTVRAMRQNGATVAVYLHVEWGQHNMLDVLNDLEGYSCLSDIQNDTPVFIDQAPLTVESIGGLKAIKQRAIELGFGGTLIANPGTVFSERGEELVAVFSESLMEVYDVTVTFEGSFESYRDSFIPHPAWTAGYEYSRFAHLVHTASLPEAFEAADLAKRRGAGMFGATDLESLPVNTWGELPSYWRMLPDVLQSR